jgi:hypothetical protein
MKSITLVLLVIAYSALSQPANLKKIREVKLQANVKAISVDRLGGFYTSNDCGIEQFDPEGKLKARYNPKGCTSTQLLEAWALARIYAYQKEKQQFIVFDSKMDILEVMPIDPSFAVEPQLATPTSDLKSYWILDIDNSLKKVDLNTKSVSLESEDLKNIKGRFIHIREYQGMLFILNVESGIYIINKLGKLIHTIDASNLSYFSFAGEDLYYLRGNQLHFYDIFSQDSYSIEISVGYKFAVATDERLILIKDGLAEMFEFTPRK